MVFGILVLFALCIALLRAVVMRPIPVAVGLSVFFNLVQADVGPILAFSLPLFLAASVNVAQDWALTHRSAVIRQPAKFVALSASSAVAWQIAVQISHLI